MNEILTVVVQELTVQTLTRTDSFQIISDEVIEIEKDWSEN